MLICSSCGSENLENNCFCQHCHQPLQVWRTLIIPSPLLSPKTVSSSEPETYPSQSIAANSLPPSLPCRDPLDDRSDSDHDQSIAGEIREALGFDPQGRYQLQPDLKALKNGTFEGIVVDRQPSASSPISDVQRSWLHETTLVLEDWIDAGTLPRAAIPYIALQSDYFPSIPELHDAWSVPDYTVLLIEDRHSWPSLASAWSSSADSLLPKIHWCYEMLLLWEALIPWQCQGSLLLPNVLKVDDHQLLCLSALIIDPYHAPPQLHQLGTFWHQLIQSQVSPPRHGELLRLIQSVATGDLAQLPQIQDHLARLAETVQREDAAIVSQPTIDRDRPINVTDQPLASIQDTRAYNRRANSMTDAQNERWDSLMDSAEAAGSDTDTDDSDSPSADDFVDAPTMMLPMKLVQMEEAGHTDIGKQRTHNEDYFYSWSQLQKHNSPAGLNLEARGLFILCDGMGGHASGEVASRLAVDTLKAYFATYWENDGLPDEATLKKAALTANQAIYRYNQQDARAGSGRMGTTLVMMLLHNLNTAIVHVGDSRLYSFDKRSGLKQLTTDHEVGQREINRGVEPAIAYARPDAYQLTQALGPRDDDALKPSISYQAITEDTLLILCSDGMSDNDLLEQNVDQAISPLLRSKTNLIDGLEHLIELANDKNGHDNITAILVRLKLKPDLNQLASEAVTSTTTSL